MKIRLYVNFVSEVRTPGLAHGLANDFGPIQERNDDFL